MRAQITFVGILIIAGMTACGGNEDSSKSFCEKFTSVEGELAELNKTAPDDLQDVVDKLDDIDPPSEIANEYKDLISTYEVIASGDSALTDPAIASKLSEAQANLTKVEAFIAKKC